MRVCNICQNISIKTARVGCYEKCSGCGHEVHVGPLSDRFIVNDELFIDSVQKIDGLLKYKKKIVEFCMKDDNFLLDVGSASGKFLYNLKNKFRGSAGVEITPECIKFSKDQLQLRIVQKISELADVKLSVVTFWHTMEHIPFPELQEILSFIKKHSTADSKLIISVPNADSTLYRLNGSNFAYYDNASHIHQFSPRSLDLLLGQFGFVQERRFFSFAYSFFGYLQTWLNSGNLKRNFLYFFLKRGEKFGLNKPKIYLLFIYNIVLAGLLIIPALVGCIYDAIFKNRAVVLTLCYHFEP